MVAIQSKYENHTAQWILHISLLVALCGLLYFPYLSATPFFDKGEPREALAVLDIVHGGDWLVPLKRATEIPSKPPLFHWSAAVASSIAGRLNEATIRFPSALYATLGVLLIYALGRKLFAAQIALLGGGILATILVYANQALSARVDMTLCFFVTLSLVIFYSLYREFLTRGLWYYAFYAVVGIGILAKGPLGVLLPGLVAGIFLVAKKRWDFLAKLSFHPGTILTLLLGAGWYAIAVTRGGEGFVDRQLLQENLSRFFGGSGHSHPVYYYIPYLFSQSVPWSLFLPFALWDAFAQGLLSDDDSLFLKLWFLVMFVFFSVSAGKRAVYLLPLYPPLSLVLASWFHQQGTASGARSLVYRSIAIVVIAFGLLFFISALGAMWNRDTGWFFAPIESLLKTKDRVNLALVRNELGAFNWTFTIVLLLSSVLWRCLWVSRMRAVACQLLMISILLDFVAAALVMPAIARTKSYRPFMEEVNQRMKPGDKLYLYDDSFNSDSVVFYRGGPIDMLEQPAQLISKKLGSGDEYVIMSQKAWRAISASNPDLPPPLLQSEGSGPEGDALLVLIKKKSFSSD
jgi:4-amino-4-deoxy-L-arabinose transferase-like glycosyltransferase